MTTEQALALWLLMAGTVLPAVLACGGAQVAPSTNTHVMISDVPADLQSDYESFTVNCSKCHQLERALAAPVTDVKHWDVYVAKMMRTAGSAINKEEAPHILRFLYWYTEHKTGRAQGGDDSTRPPESAPPAVPASGSSEVPLPESGGDREPTQGESTP